LKECELATKKSGERFEGNQKNKDQPRRFFFFFSSTIAHQKKIVKDTRAFFVHKLRPQVAKKVIPATKKVRYVILCEFA
jgi:hypothetical protein